MNQEQLNHIRTTIAVAIKDGIAVAMEADGYTKRDAAVVVSQYAVAVASGFVSAAMGKQAPTREDAARLATAVIDIIAEMPDTK